jgi:hypothetical protein
MAGFESFISHCNHCPCSFCDNRGDHAKLEDHLSENHQFVWETSAFYSEIHLQLANLLGIGIEVEKQRLWSCPFPTCDREFDKYSEIPVHVDQDHSPHEKFLYDQLGGCWATIFCHVHDHGT